MRPSGQARHRVVAAAVTALNLAAGLLVAAALIVGIPPGPVSTAAAASCGTTNIALDKTATASSLENASFPASAAVDGNTGTLPVTGTGRYIRMNGTARATPYGYSLWEFQVYAS